MTPDPIPRATESASDTPLTEFTQDQVKMGTVRPESAREALLAARQVGEQFGTNAVQRKLYGDIAETGAKAAALADPTPAPSGDEVAELRAKLRSAEATIANALDRETQALDDLAAAKTRLKVLGEALRPFADLPGYTCIRDEVEADVDFTRRVPNRNRRHTLSVADFRRARAALYQHQKGDGHGE